MTPSPGTDRIGRAGEKAMTPGQSIDLKRRPEVQKREPAERRQIAEAWREKADLSQQSPGESSQFPGCAGSACQLRSNGSGPSGDQDLRVPYGLYVTHFIVDSSDVDVADTSLGIAADAAVVECVGIDRVVECVGIDCENRARQRALSAGPATHFPAAEQLPLRVPSPSSTSFSGPGPTAGQLPLRVPARKLTADEDFDRVVREQWDYHLSSMRPGAARS